MTNFFVQKIMRVMSQTFWFFGYGSSFGCIPYSCYYKKIIILSYNYVSLIIKCIIISQIDIIKCSKFYGLSCKNFSIYDLITYFMFDIMYFCNKITYFVISCIYYASFSSAQHNFSFTTIGNFFYEFIGT